MTTGPPAHHHRLPDTAALLAWGLSRAPGNLGEILAQPRDKGLRRELNKGSSSPAARFVLDQRVQDRASELSQPPGLNWHSADGLQELHHQARPG